MSTPYVPSVYVPGQQNQNHSHHQLTHGSPYAAQPQVMRQPHQPTASASQSQPYIPGQFERLNQHVTSSLNPGPTVPYAVGVQEHHQGAYDPNDPDGERGILETGGKIALGLGAAAVAYSAYNQYQQQHEQQQQQLVYGSTHQAPAFDANANGNSFGTPQRRGVLTIYLDRLSNLANKDLLSKSDPYVRLSLEQDNWIRDIDHGTQVSGRKTGDLNPVYNEVFHFNLPTLRNMVLKVKVMDDDGGFTSDDALGSCRIKLWELNLSRSPQSVERVIDRNAFSRNGKCHLRLAYSG